MKGKSYLTTVFLASEGFVQLALLPSINFHFIILRIFCLLYKAGIPPKKFPVHFLPFFKDLAF